MLIALLRKYLGKITGCGQVAPSTQAPTRIDQQRLLSVFAHTYGAYKGNLHNLPQQFLSVNADTQRVITFSYPQQYEDAECYKATGIEVHTIGNFRVIICVTVSFEKLQLTRTQLLHELYQLINKIPKGINHKVIKIVLAMHFKQMFSPS